MTVLRHVRARLPREDIVYLADQAHVPYGDRDADELEALLAENARFLAGRGVDAIVMGCNTSCAVAAERGWPPSSATFLDIISAAAAGVAASGATRIGVVATTATARSGAYGRAIRALVPNARVDEAGAPRLVPLVEAGETSGPVARAAVAEACAPFPDDIEAIVLACTHYPLLDAEFAAVLGPRVRRLDPAVAQAERARGYVAERGGERGSGRTSFATTGDLAAYRTAVARILGPTRNADFTRARVTLPR